MSGTGYVAREHLPVGELVAEVRHLLSTEAGTQDLRSQLAKNPELANKLAAVAREAGTFPPKAPPPVLVEPSPEATRLEEAARRGGGVPAKDPPPRKAPPPQLPAGCPPATSTATTGPPPLPPPPTEPKAPPASLRAASVNKIDKEVDWAGFFEKEEATARPMVRPWDCQATSTATSSSAAMATPGQSSTEGGYSIWPEPNPQRPRQGRAIRSHSRAPHAQRPGGDGAVAATAWPGPCDWASLLDSLGALSGRQGRRVGGPPERPTSC